MQRVKKEKKKKKIKNKKKKWMKVMQDILLS